MNYALGYGFKLSELALNLPTNKLTIKPEQWRKYGNRKDEVIYNIFADNVKMVLEDIIHNDVTFELPTGGKKADIHMIKLSGDAFIKARKNGKFKNIDYLKSMFTGYQPGLFMYGNKDRVKPIYVDKNLKDQLEEEVNSGHTYG